jgi:hypothetical protein
MPVRRGVRTCDLSSLERPLTTPPNEASHVSVFWVLEEVAVFQEVSCLVVEHSICKVTEELKWELM